MILQEKGQLVVIGQDVKFLLKIFKEILKRNFVLTNDN